MATKKIEKEDDKDIDIFEPETWVLKWEVIDGVEQSKSTRTKKTKSSEEG